MFILFLNNHFYNYVLSKLYLTRYIYRVKYRNTALCEIDTHIDIDVVVDIRTSIYR